VGFRRVTDYATAPAQGREFVGHYRKNPPHTTVAGNWYDLSIAAGFPRPNYFAATPLESAVLDGKDGILYGYVSDRDVNNVAPASLHLARWHLASPTAAFNGQHILLDYLLYYPFVDGDAVGEDQDLANSVSLPRYASGENVSVMGVCQAPTVGGGAFTFNYVDSDDNTFTSPVISLGAAAMNIGSLIRCTPATADS
jgi:hypothetical protein